MSEDSNLFTVDSGPTDKPAAGIDMPYYPDNYYNVVDF